MHTASFHSRRVRTIVLASAVVFASSLPNPMDAGTVQNVTQAAVNKQQSTGYRNGTKVRDSGGGDPANADALPVGRVIYAELAQTIDVRKAKPGELIVAKVTLGVLSNGTVLVAEGAKITGHVTEVKKRSDRDAKSVLGIVFERADTVDGKELPLNLTVQAIGVGQLREPPDTKLDAESPYSAAGGALSVGGGMNAGRGSQRDDLPEAETKPALDIGSKGMIGLKGLVLTEGRDAASGSLVTSVSRNVKLDSGWQVVLRVISPKAPVGKAVSKD